jgi:hypothetical protein
LQEFTLFWRVIVLEVRLDRLVLLVKERQVGNEVFHDIHCNHGGVEWCQGDIDGDVTARNVL